MSLFSPLGITSSLTTPLIVALHLAPLVDVTASLKHAYVKYVATHAFLDKPLITSPISRSLLCSVTSPPATTHGSSSNQDMGTERLDDVKELIIPA